MLSKKEKIVYSTLKTFINEKGYSPTIRELCAILNYKSTNSIYRYIKSLSKLGMINYIKHKSRSITIFKPKECNIKDNNINLNSDEFLYQIKNNNFKSKHILKDDYLVINSQKKLHNNDLGLFLINKNYRIMQYNYIDGYYILEDSEKLILSKVNILGKVCNVYRKIN